MPSSAPPGQGHPAPLRVHMSSWPGAGAAMTLVYEARQGANKEGMSKRTGMTELTIVGRDILATVTLGLSWTPLFT